MRSHLDGAWSVAWWSTVGKRRAVDAEWVRSEVPRAARRAARQLRLDDPWIAWTRLEVIAKLTDVPVVTLLHGPVPHLPDSVTLTSHRAAGITVSVGAAA